MFGKFSREISKQVSAEYAAGDSVDDISFDFSSQFDKVPEVVQSFLEDVGAQSAHNAVASVGIDDEGIFGLANTRAIAYAEERAAEMVGRKWVDGVLVDNPDARWVISDTTRDNIQTLVTKAYEDGKTPAKLAEQIKDSETFSAARAKLIAKTETSTASINGTLSGWRESGVVEGKSSLLSSDHDKDDECDDNADAGVVALDDDFPSGDDGPPYHPGCDCSLVAEVIETGSKES